MEQVQGVGNRVANTPHEQAGLELLIFVREGIVEAVELLLCDHGGRRRDGLRLVLSLLALARALVDVIRMLSFLRDML